MNHIYTLSIRFFGAFHKMLILSIVCILIPGKQQMVNASAMSTYSYTGTATQTHQIINTIKKETTTTTHSNTSHIPESPASGKTLPPARGIGHAPHGEAEHHVHEHDAAHEHHINISFPLFLRLVIILLFIVCFI